MRRACLCLVIAGCTDGFPPDRGGQPFWAAFEPEAGADLGHSPVLLEPGAQRPISFAEVTGAAGLSSLKAGGNPHGVGVAFLDLDGDRWPDLFVANGKLLQSGPFVPLAFWHNQGDGTFADHTVQSGIAALGSLDTYSVAAGDYDRDGDLDLYLGAQPRDRLLENRGGVFVDVTEAALAGGPESDATLIYDGKSKVVSFGDYDDDGWLDIVSASSTLPEPYAYLLRNQGDGTFADVTTETGVFADSFGNPCAVLFSDYDNDGDRDLWIWNDRGDKVLLRNDDRARFTDVTTAAGLDDVGIRHPMGIDSADIDHDGDLDTYVTNIGDNPLLRNNGDGTFSDITAEAGTGGDFGWGTSFEDFDHDGWADLFVAQEDALPYLVFQNLGVDGVARFERSEVRHPPVDQNPAHNVAAAFADYDQDGRVDVALAHTDGSPIQLFANTTDTGGRHWLEVVVPRAPGNGHAGGISARIGVKTGDLVQFRDLTSGSSRASQNEISARFGLGGWDGADWVVALWPDGRSTVVRRVAADRRLVLEMP